MKVTLAAVKQEITDFKNEVLSDLKEIKAQTSKTNGRVNTHDTDIQLVTLKQDNCSARKYFENENKSTKWGRIGLLATIILNGILVAINVKLLYGG